MENGGDWGRLERGTVGPKGASIQGASAPRRVVGRAVRLIGVRLSLNGERPGICPLGGAALIRADRGKSPGWWWCGSSASISTVHTGKLERLLFRSFGKFGRAGGMASGRNKVSRPHGVVSVSSGNTALQPVHRPSSAPLITSMHVFVRFVSTYYTYLGTH